MKAELIVALDVPSARAIPPIVDSLAESVSFYKVGLELFTAEGPSALAYLKEEQKRVFLDLKLHDIPRTVAHAVKSATRHGVDLLTVHGGGGYDMLRAAADAAAKAGPAGPKLLAITTLTSLNQDDLTQLDITRPLLEHTLSIGKLAISAGIDGLVCSPKEVSQFREALGTDPILVTPGIRPAGTGTAGTGTDPADQKRVATPGMAVRAGASHLVVGRPILQADDPAAAARAILEEMAAAG